MPTSQPSNLNFIASACSILSRPVAIVHFLFVRAGFIRIPACVYEAPGGAYINLFNIWYSRIFRRVTSLLLRSPFRDRLCGLVKAPVINGGCIITMCHTPWSRLLAHWCFKNNFGLVLTSNSLNQQINRIRRNGKGFAEMRELIPYLQSGGKIIVMTDVFNDLNDCTVGFLGKNCNVSLLPVRLAKAAGVSLLSAVAELHESSIQIYMGPRLNPENFIADPSKSMQTLLSFFQREIKRNPSIWSVFVRGSLSRYERECRRSTFVSQVLPAKSLSVVSNS